MSITHQKTLKTTVLTATALAAGSVWGKTPISVDGSDGPRLGRDYLALDEVATQDVITCLPPKENAGEEFTGIGPDQMWIVVDAVQSAKAKISFVVSDMVATDEDQILFLAASSNFLSGPAIQTDRNFDGLPTLNLDMADLQILGTYQLRPLPIQASLQETDLGKADLKLASKVTISVNLDQDLLTAQLRQGRDTFYIQAAMISATDLAEDRLNKMILSEMDTLVFVDRECPVEETKASFEANESGTVTKTPSQNSTANPNSDPNPGSKTI